MGDSSVFSDGELLEVFSDYSDPASLNAVTSSMAEDPPVDDGFCTFQVENFLYRISSQFFDESPSVKHKIQEAQALGGGTSDGRPIVISGIASHEMDCLLDVAESRNSRIPFRNFDIEILRTAMSSAIKFGMRDLRSHIIDLFEARDPPLQIADRLKLADEFGMKTWLESAYLVLCKRGTLPSDEEAVQLGGLRCVAIWRLRNKGRKSLESIHKDLTLQTSNIVTPVDLSESLSFVTALSNDELTKHPIYYFPGIDIEREGKPYRVPRYIFAEDRPSMETLKNALERVSVLQLERLLGAVNLSDPMTFVQLEPALEAATILRLRSIRPHFIQQVEALDPSPSPAELISLADRCAVQHWLKPQYSVLCRREDRLTTEEAKVLGMERVMAISNVREKRWRRMIQIGTSNCVNQGGCLHTIERADDSGDVTRRLIGEEPSLK